MASLNFQSLLIDLSCFRNDDLDINIFIHVDDGLLFGPSSELQRLIEHLSSQVMMRKVGRLAQQNAQVFFLGSVIMITVRGNPVEAKPKYIRDVITVLGPEDAKPVATPSARRAPTTESLVETGER